MSKRAEPRPPHGTAAVIHPSEVSDVYHSHFGRWQNQALKSLELLTGAATGMVSWALDPPQALGGSGF